MAEYIERDKVLALAEDFEEIIDDGSDEIFFEYIPIDKVQALPAANVRPVVRCRDCKYNNACLTQAFVEDESRVPFDRSAFFCADGKRADDA